MFKKRNLDTDAIIDSIYGLAGCPYKPDGHGQLVNYLSSVLLHKLKKSDFTYN